MSEPAREVETTVNRSAVLRGTVVGLVLVVPITIVGAVLDRSVSNFDDSGWRIPLFLAILVSYAIAGWCAGWLSPLAPLTNGALAGLGTFVLWVPIRVLIWLARDETHGLVSGRTPVFRIGQVFGQVVLSTALGMLGGWLASRSTRSRDEVGRAGPV